VKHSAWDPSCPCYVNESSTISSASLQRSVEVRVTLVTRSINVLVDLTFLGALGLSEVVPWNHYELL